MFLYDRIQQYSDTDMAIYRYITAHLEQVPYMTIRELAGQVHASPAAILRFCEKNGYEGYARLKEALRQETAACQAAPPLPELKELSDFFQRANSSAFEAKLLPAVEALRRARLVVFLGMGSSGTLARYGARFFSNMGKFSVGLEDTYYPLETFDGRNTAVIVLSESGETREVVERTQQFQRKGCFVLSITNSVHSTLAKMADWNFSYHVQRQRINGGYNGTTQVPVLFVIESLAKRLSVETSL